MKTIQFFLVIVLFCFISIEIYSQEQMISQYAVSASYYNLNDTQKENNLLGLGMILYSSKHSQFLDIKFLFPVGTNNTDIKFGVDVSAGLEYVLGKNLPVKDLIFSGLFGAGIVNYSIKNDKETRNYLGMQTSFGVQLNYKDFTFDYRINPIILLESYRFIGNKITLSYNW